MIELVLLSSCSPHIVPFMPLKASSEQKKTVSTQFLNYLIKDEKPRFDGVMFYEIIEN